MLRRASRPSRLIAGGTSFATPVATARMALLLARPDHKAAQQALQLLKSSTPELQDEVPGLRYVEPPGNSTLSAQQ